MVCKIGKNVEKRTKQPTSSFIYSNTHGEPIAQYVSLSFERQQKEGVYHESQSRGSILKAYLLFLTFKLVPTIVSFSLS